MKYLVAAFLLFFSSIIAAAPLTLVVINVYDGDTIETRITLPPPLNKVSIRILGIDTPEMPAKSYASTGKLGRAKCVQEAELALAARRFVRVLTEQSNNIIYVENYKWDKYGGRIDGDVAIINKATGEFIDIADALIKDGYAVPYDGGTKTHDWCK